jgi:apolipoprotein N-acyltransferase
MNGPALKTLTNYALALATAALLVLIFPSYNLAWLAPFALTPLLVALSREPRPMRRFLLGYAAGLAYWFFVCNWIQFVLEAHGGMGRWGGWGAFLLFCLVKAMHLGVFAMTAAIVLPKWYAIPAVAALWTGIERTHGPFGFAWLALGNAGIEMPLAMRAAPFIGVYGLSFLFATMGAAAAVVALRRGRKQLLWLVPAPALFLLPPLPAPKAGHESAVLVQPNISEDAEWTRDSIEQMHRRLIALSLQRGVAPLIVWPEVPGPIYYYRDAAFREKAQTLARLTGARFLFGTVAHTPSGGPLNSAVLLGPDGAFSDRYDKINLVPFGEFIPPLFGFVNRITQEAGDFTPGNRVVIFRAQEHKLGVFICYESAFPSEVRQFAKGGAEVLVNISNDGYFGHSDAREQHLAIVRMRAAENRRWILRATNDGVTASIDPAGRVMKRLPMYAENAGRFEYSYVSATTLYTRCGDWFAWGCLIAGATALFASQIPSYRPRLVV